MSFRRCVLFAIFLFLCVWAWFWPHTGDGDAAQHFIRALQDRQEPQFLVIAWARPLWKICLIPMALLGHFPARVFQALLTTLLCWQTWCLAEDCQLANAFLAPFLILAQPFAFALASDTMSEMPMALALVMAIRLWIKGRPRASLFVAGLLPLIRPEGFVLIGVWLAMGLWRCGPGALNGGEGGEADAETSGRGDVETGTDKVSRTDVENRSVEDRFYIRRSTVLTLSLPRSTRRWYLAKRLDIVWLGAGLAAWVLAEWIITGDALYFLRRAQWSWPVASYASYRRGPLYGYVQHWPEYCGPVLFPAFFLGMAFSWSRRMRLPWVCLLLVAAVHSLLWWQGVFASAGLLRVLACACPATALICLNGFNAATTWAGRRVASVLAGMFALAGMLFAVKAYAVEPMHYEFRPMMACCRYVREQRLRRQPTFFAASESVLAELALPPTDYTLIPCGRQQTMATLGALPLGSLGVWDNCQGVSWHELTIEQACAMGFQILFEAVDRQRGIRYAVITKTP